MTKSTLLPWSLAFAGLLAALRQDPEKARPPAPPAGTPPLPTVEEPFVSPVPRLDLLQRFTPRDPLEGFYELRDYVVDGHPHGAKTRGWLAIGRHMLLLQMLGEGAKPGVPLLRADVRHWQRQGEQMRTTVLAGHFNAYDGELKLLQGGSVETRRFEATMGRLRIWQDEGSYMEFVRIE